MKQMLTPKSLKKHGVFYPLEAPAVMERSIYLILCLYIYIYLDTSFVGSNDYQMTVIFVSSENIFVVLS